MWRIVFLPMRTGFTTRCHGKPCTTEELEWLQGHLLCKPTKARLSNRIYNTSAMLLHNPVCYQNWTFCSGCDTAGHRGSLGSPSAALSCLVFFFPLPNFLSASPWQTTRWVNSTDVRLSCAARRSQSRGSYMSVTPCSPVGCLFNGRKSERVPGDGWLRKRQGKRMLPLFIYSSQGRASRAWKPRLAGKQKSETCLTSPTIIIVNELMGTVYLQSHWSVSYAGIWFQCNVNKLQILRPSLIQLIRLWQALCFSKLWDFVSPKGARLSRRKRIHESNKQTSSVRHDRLSSSSTFHNIIVLKWN